MDFPKALFVVAAFISIYLGLQLYLFLRAGSYIRSRITDQQKQRLALYLVSFFFLLMLVPFGWRAYVGPYPPNYPGYVAWLGRLFSDLFAVWGFGSVGCALVWLGYDLYRWGAKFSSVRRSTGPDLGRRDFLKKGVSAAAAAPFLISGYGVLLARHRYEVDYFDLPVSGLSSSLSNLSIVQLTDIHAGPFMPEEELMAYVEAVNRLRPDLIALTGDFISSSPDEVLPCVNALSGLKARYGVFACIGNHDLFARVDDELARLLRERGVQVLRNDAASIRVGNTALNVLGIEDLRKGVPDLPRALKLAQREPGEVRVLLSHRPEIFPAASQEEVDIVVSGHYHGGQIKLSDDPESFSIARLITPYAEGLFHLSGRHVVSQSDKKDKVLFVGRGIGTTGLPIRINCPPQIAHLKLVKA